MRWLAAIAGAVLLAGLGAGVLLARQTHSTAFDRWLGKAGMAAVGPDAALVVQNDAVSNVLDGNQRARLRLDARRASGLALALARLGPPPDHEADVVALIGKLQVYADAALAVSTCKGDCGLLNQRLDGTLVDVTLAMGRVHTDAAPRRGTGVFKPGDQ